MRRHLIVLDATLAAQTMEIPARVTLWSLCSPITHSFNNVTFSLPASLLAVWFFYAQALPHINSATAAGFAR